MSSLKTIANRLLISILFLSVLWIFTHLHKNQTDLSDPSSLKSASGHRKGLITILLTKWSGSTDIWGWDQAHKVCSPKCEFVTDKSLLTVSSAVVFHGNNQGLLRQGWIRPSPSQIWVWINLEPPTNYEFKPTDSLEFNWTLTYRSDSDLVVPYSRIFSTNNIPYRMQVIKNYIEKSQGNTNPPTLPSLSGFRERKTAGWIVSHCETPSKREQLVAEMQKYITVDIYGSCGPLKCKLPRNKDGKGEGCHLQIHQKYKFYLAFENSLCTDYVTEKYFDILTLEMIPVVYGSAKYASQFPPNSFINVLDFKTISDLVQHLHYVSDNPDIWLQYFSWRKDYWILKTTFLPALCDICDKLINDSESISSGVLQKSYKNVHEWWLMNQTTNESICKNEADVDHFLQDYFMNED